MISFFNDERTEFLHYTNTQWATGERSAGFLKEILPAGLNVAPELARKQDRAKRETSQLASNSPAVRYSIYSWKSVTEPWVNSVPRSTVQHFYGLSYCWWSWRTLPQHYWRLASPCDSISCTSNTRSDYLMGKGEAMPSMLSIRRLHGSFNIFFG